MNEIMSVRGGMIRRRLDAALARIDDATSLKEYQCDREAELAVHKQRNVDYVTMARLPCP